MDEHNTQVSVFIRGERISLRALDMDHVTLYHGWHNDEKIRLYFGTSAPRSLSDIGNMVSNSSQNIIHFEIWHNEDHKPIGLAKIGGINWIRRKCSIGGLIGDTRYWNQGLGTELTNLLIDYIFGELNLHKIATIIYSPNKASQVCAERCGFQLEAKIGDAGYFDGKYCEDLYYALYDHQWREKRKGK